MIKPMSTIVRLCDEQFLECCDEQIAAFYQLWKSKCKGAILPSRKDFDPVDMADYLSGITMVDVDPTTLELSYRLVGTGEVKIRGNDPTGKPVSEMFLANSWADTQENYNYVIKHRSFLFDATNMPQTSGEVVVDETLFLPLCGTDNKVNIVLSYSVQKKT